MAEKYDVNHGLAYVRALLGAADTFIETKDADKLTAWAVTTRTAVTNIDKYLSQGGQFPVAWITQENRSPKD